MSYYEWARWRTRAGVWSRWHRVLAGHYWTACSREEPFEPQATETRRERPAVDVCMLCQPRAEWEAEWEARQAAAVSEAGARQRASSRYISGERPAPSPPAAK